MTHKADESGMSRGFRLDRRDIASVILLTALVWLVFAQTLHFSFIRYDDPNIIYGNPHVRDGLTRESVQWAFTHPHHYLYMPLTSLTHLADVSLYGLDPGGHHLTSLLLHQLNACLLYVALAALTGRRGASLFVAALFAVHPLRAASVAWLASRKDLTGGFFFFAALWAYASYARKPGWLRYCLVAVLLMLGLLSKPVLVTAPCVLLLLDWWPLDRIGSPRPRDAAWRRAVLRLLLEKMPLFALTACASYAAVLAERLDGGGLAENAVPLGLRASDALLNYMRYLELFLTPINLAIHYPPNGFTFSWTAAAGAGALLLALSVFTLCLWRRRYLAMGWLWFLGMLVPNIGLVRYDHAPFAARHSYLPLIGIVIAIAFAGSDRYQTAERSTRRALAALAAALVLAAAWAGYWQTSYWRDTLTVFQRAAAVTRNNDVAHKILGQEFFEAGKTDQALEQFERAVEADPSNSDGYMKLGFAQLQMGRYADAEAQFALVTRFLPGDIEANILLGEARVFLGQYAAAIGPLEQANRLAPGNMKTKTLIEIALRRMGAEARAERLWREILDAIANNPELAPNAADLLYKAQLPEMAEQCYAKASARKAPPDIP